MFRTIATDNTDNEVVIQGARSKNSNADVASLVFRNYDDDTKMTYRMAEIAVRDAYANAQSNGFGNLIFYTNGDGTTSNAISERMIIDYQGNVGIATLVPNYKLHVNGDIKLDGTLILGNGGISGLEGGSNIVSGDVTWTSNLSVGTSNALYPGVAWTSNLSVGTSNALYPGVAWTSNLSVGTSNALYTRRESYLQATSPTKVYNEFYTNVWTFINDQNSSLSAKPTSLLVGAFLYSRSNNEITSSNFRYDIRVYDSTTNQVLGEITRSNADNMFHNITLSNVNNAGISMIEIHAKKRSLGEFVQLDGMSLKYEF